jgi:hypothetical protein
MRKTKTLQINNEEITVKELSVRDVMGFWDRLDDADTRSLVDQAAELMKKCAGLDPEALKGLYPSEIEALWDAVKEVNGAFFAMARKAGLTEVTEQVATTIRTNFLKQFAGAFTPDIETA